MLNSALTQGLVVSIVDDDPSVCEGLQDLLNSLGVMAETFQGADAFLQSDRLDQTACLIADVQMPGMTGLDLHRHLVASGNSIPTILITAYPDNGIRERALGEGVVGYLSKPFEETDLLACLYPFVA